VAVCAPSGVPAQNAFPGVNRCSDQILDRSGCGRCAYGKPVSAPVVALTGEGAVPHMGSLCPGFMNTPALDELASRARRSRRVIG